MSDFYGDPPSVIARLPLKTYNIEEISEALDIKIKYLNNWIRDGYIKSSVNDEVEWQEKQFFMNDIYAIALTARLMRLGLTFMDAIDLSGGYSGKNRKDTLTKQVIVYNVFDGNKYNVAVLKKGEKIDIDSVTRFAECSVIINMAQLVENIDNTFEQVMIDKLLSID